MVLWAAKRTPRPVMLPGAKGSGSSSSSGPSASKEKRPTHAEHLAFGGPFAKRNHRSACRTAAGSARHPQTACRAGYAQLPVSWKGKQRGTEEKKNQMTETYNSKAACSNSSRDT